jgi:hypothetical protein
MRHNLMLVALAVLAPAAVIRADDGIPQKALDKLKAATVVIRADHGEQEGNYTFSSGFLIQTEGEIGVVVGAVPPTRPGQNLGNVTITLAGAAKDEKPLAAKILASDGSKGLIVLKVTSKALPQPLDVSEKVDVRETMTVIIFSRDPVYNQSKIQFLRGYISAIQTDDSGKAVKIRLQGVPPYPQPSTSSGGPVSDSQGRVMGLYSEGTIIPCETLATFYNGRVTKDVMVHIDSLDKGRAEISASVVTVDPFKKLKKAELLYVAKEAVKEEPKPDSAGNWAELPHAERVALKIETDEATGKFSLKNLAADRKRSDYVFQAVYTNGEGKSVGAAPVELTIDFHAAQLRAAAGFTARIKQAPGVTAPTGRDFAFAVKLPPFYTAQLDPKAGMLLLVATDGSLKQYSYPDFKLKAEFRVPGDLAGYQSALDTNKGVLYLAVAANDKLSKLHETDTRIEAFGDILALDVAHLADKKNDVDNYLKTVAEYKTAAIVRNLSVSPDGKAVYFLDATKEDNPRLKRIDTSSKKIDAEVKLADATGSMCLTPDGKMMYAVARKRGEGTGAAAGLIQKIDPDEMKVLKTIDNPLEPLRVVADDDGQVYVSSVKQNGDVVMCAVDMSKTYKLLSTWASCGTSMALSPSGGKLYVAFTRPSRSLAAYTIPEKLDSGFPGNRIVSTAEHPPSSAPDQLTSNFYLTPDGNCLLCSSGAVFWTAAARSEK